ncbi:hypothetical protein [Bifidobacterium sp. SO1]|uniref:hypothetical protein n=1 Tax=Bifidobacterium sp. SO1 TaxID=2809029 RepID=UPI001BDD25B8|nr:hypothetical protein [Bifidobacterium sp. SO1]MBT1162098.1 hypothetical protein [Bifidobacterium sp. SO1]
MGARGFAQENLVGQKFGKLTVLKMIPGTKTSEASVLCECECGKLITVITGNLKGGNTRSCGCLVKEARNKADRARRDGTAPKRTTHRYKSKELVGKKINHLTILAIEGKNKHNQTMVKCRCDCGNTIIVRMSSITNGNTQSCGCMRAKAAKQTHATHGDSGKDSDNRRLYQIWNKMNVRCSNPKAQYYSSYGGRGISVCDEWKQWEPFRDWALDHGYTDDLTIDRINNEHDYTPENCRWVTPMENSNNKRNNLYIMYQGEIKTCAEWSRFFSLPYKKLYDDVRSMLDNASMTQEHLNPIELPPMTGDYGYLTVIEDAGRDEKGNRLVRCKCICGTVKTYRLSTLKSGRTLSCGCMRRVLMAHRKAKHLDSVPESEFHNLYGVWKTMRHRYRVRDNCKTVPFDVCDEWSNDWLSFKEWSVSHGYEVGKKLVRIDNSKGYAPDNCLWVVEGAPIFRYEGVIV